MNIKKFLFAAIAGVVGNVIAYVVLEELIFKGYMERNFYRPIGISLEGTPLWPLIGVLAMALIMAYIYPKGYEGGAPVAEGFRFGVFLGLFSGIPFGVFMGTMFPIGIGPILILIFLYTLEVTATGLLVGLVYGRVKLTE
jgi:hypothetical protein